jgi:hypothetical protein
MVLLVAAVVSVLGLSPLAEGHPIGFHWMVTTPTQGVVESHLEHFPFLITEDGDFHIRLETAYLHQSPFGPMLWVSVDETVFSTILFGDDFESGNTNAWN